MNLGPINLLPIPVLDGGWLAIFLVEAVRGRPLKDEHRGFAQFVGLALLIVLMIFATQRSFQIVLIREVDSCAEQPEQSE